MTIRAAAAVALSLTVIAAPAFAQEQNRLDDLDADRFCIFVQNQARGRRA